MQDLVADMDKEIASARQKAIDLRARMIYLETLQTKAALDPTLQGQIVFLKQSFDRAKGRLSAMEAKKKHLIERMTKASTAPASNPEPASVYTGSLEDELAQMRRALLEPPQPLTITEMEALLAKLDQL